MNGDDYKEMIAHAIIGKEVMRLVRESGLMVPRQKPGRKPAPPAKAAKPQAPAAKARPAPATEDEE